MASPIEFLPPLLKLNIMFRVINNIKKKKKQTPPNKKNTFEDRFKKILKVKKPHLNFRSTSVQHYLFPYIETDFQLNLTRP